MLASTQAEVQSSPLTQLTEEEKLFQSTVRRFAREQIAPHVREMDDAGVFRKDIIGQFFELGLMGIEIPEEYGGQGGSFFQCILAVEALSAVDPSAGVIVDVQNTIVDNCAVPKANVLGEVGRGYKIAIETLNEGRIAIGAQMIGLAGGALEHAIGYAKQRKQFGKMIGEFQGVQFELAKMATEVEAARLLVYNAARLRDAGHPFVTEAAMAKYFSSEIAEKAASKAIELFGGVGVTREY